MTSLPLLECHILSCKGSQECGQLLEVKHQWTVSPDVWDQQYLMIHCGAE